MSRACGRATNLADAALPGPLAGATKLRHNFELAATNTRAIVIVSIGIGLNDKRHAANTLAATIAIMCKQQAAYSKHYVYANASMAMMCVRNAHRLRGGDKWHAAIRSATKHICLQIA